MNNRLDTLHLYPFERLNELLAGVTPSSNHSFIPLSLGEPKHDTADFLIDLLTDEQIIKNGVGTYPPTRGTQELRTAIADFINQRFNLTEHPLDPESHVLPVNGTREALFSFAQAVLDDRDDSVTLMPNPFYQIYEGAALLAGSQPEYIPCHVDSQFHPDYSQVSEETWQHCKLLYICTPGNPAGAVMSNADMQYLIRLSDTYDFVIASDECYSEIYLDESKPPAGLLQAASAMGRADYKNCMAFNSLSKRSNLPGLRSGYVAGDANLISRFLLYRTYHGSAMPVHTQQVSTAAWQDEEHVRANRDLYRAKYTAVLDILAPVWPMEAPPASFYLWPETPINDLDFTKQLLEHTNIKVLPGSFLSRTVDGVNPGENRVRMALVATVDECVEAANRIREFVLQQGYFR
ncbi:MAG: succinyldiaminopimelate transaminase [bacterium]|nr:succinyldiaminopimelate transaminase [Gammaproteobacteria bacterium]HIL98552.1 succinyldiaminopimelate transaminase [Pseudomonadales bacterium]